MFLSLAGKRENRDCALWATGVFTNEISELRRNAETRTEIAR